MGTAVMGLRARRRHPPAPPQPAGGARVAILNREYPSTHVIPSGGVSPSLRGSYHLKGESVPNTRSKEYAMNSLTSFLALTGAIFGAITALLVLLSRLEPSWRTQKARPSRDFQRGS